MTTAVVSRLTALMAALACAVQAAELPSASQLGQQTGATPQTVLVYEPHLTRDGEQVEVAYVGFPAVAVLEHLSGKDWQNRGDTVVFRALDGYVAHIPADRFLQDSAYLVFARQDNTPFAVDNIRQNQVDVPLGPWYLVWDNITNPALLAEGARNWPYQVAEIDHITLSNTALVPQGLDARFHEAVTLVRTHCLTCHKVNGFGGVKFEGNLAKIAKQTDKTDFFRLLLTPAATRPGATMPPLPDHLPESERHRIARIMFEYLQVVPVLP